MFALYLYLSGHVQNCCIMCINHVVCTDLDTCDVKDDPLLDLVTRFSLAACLKHCNMLTRARQAKISQ